MDKYAVIGKPISHSKSPIIHRLFAQQCEQNMEYVALLSKAECFEKDLEHFFSSNGKGLNVTLPFKLQAFQFANQLSERAKLAGAVNTLIKKDEIIIGENTDGLGLVKDLKVNHGYDLKNKSILLIGAGGASRGVIAPLLDENPLSLTIVNRTEAKAQELAELFLSYGSIEAINFEALNKQAHFDLIINASSAGLNGEAPTLLDAINLKNSFCYDMIYAKTDTPFIAWVKTKGCTHTADGLGMLVEQAAESFYLWRHVRPETQSVLQQIREGLE